MAAPKLLNEDNFLGAGNQIKWVSFSYTTIEIVEGCPPVSERWLY
jgi:hypothetical protein